MDFGALRNKTILEIFQQYSECYVLCEDGIKLVDPIEKRVIGFHYGETHLSVAYIIHGYLYDNSETYDTGVGILKYFLKHIEEYQKIDSYHWDFNNVALCVLVEFLENHNIHNFPFEINQLKELIISQEDSRHGTINWMPMRAYVNWCKFQWTQEKEYLNKAEKYLEKVKQAKYEDGFFEDFLPKGKSFNFQYHIYTTTMLTFLARRMSSVEIPIDSIQKCVDIIDADGDINYLGRGCNQIFAWGPVQYLFHSCALEPSLSKVSSYFEQHFPTALKNSNLIMADVAGDEQVWWWDYNYATVYFGHLAFWLAMTSIDQPQQVGCNKPQAQIGGDSGVRIERNDGHFFCVFYGRNHYLAEKGPVIANISLSGVGTIFKGPLGPFGGMFGNKYAKPVSSIENYLGPLHQKILLGKILLVENVFPKSIDCKTNSNSITVVFHLGKRNKNLRFSIPVMVDPNLVSIELFSDDKPVKIATAGSFIGPYGETRRLESSEFSGSVLQLRISRREKL